MAQRSKTLQRGETELTRLLYVGSGAGVADTLSEEANTPAENKANGIAINANTAKMARTRRLSFALSSSE